MVGPEIDGGSLPPVFSLECGGGASLGFQLVRGDYRAYTRQTKQVASSSVSSSCSSALCSTPSRTWWQPSTAASSSTPAGTPAWTPCSGGPGRPWSSLSTTFRCGHHLDKRYKIHAFTSTAGLPTESGESAEEHKEGCDRNPAPDREPLLQQVSVPVFGRRPHRPAPGSLLGYQQASG